MTFLWRFGRDRSLWNLGDGDGGCPSYPLSSDLDDAKDNNARKMYLNCSNGGFDPEIGTEMDWARLWWDHHEDTQKPGSVRNHVPLHNEIAAGGAWGTSDTYDVVLGGLSSTQADRFDSAAAWDGVRDGSSC